MDRKYSPIRNDVYPIRVGGADIMTKLVVAI